MAFNAIAGVVGVSVPTQDATTLTNGTYTTAYPLSNGQTLTFTNVNYHPLKEVQILAANTGGTITAGTIATNAGDSISMGTVTCDGTWKSFIFPQHSVFNSLVLTFTTVSSASIVSIRTLNITEEFSHEKQQLATRAVSTIDADTKFLAQYAVTTDESLFGFKNVATNKGRIVTAGGPWDGPYMALQSHGNARTNLIGTLFTVDSTGTFTVTGGAKKISALYAVNCYTWGLQQRLNASFDSPAVALAASTAYTFSFLIKSDLPAANLTVEVVRATGSGTATQTTGTLSALGYTTLGAWKQITGTFTSSADTVGSTYFLRFKQTAVTSTAALKSFWVGNVQLETGTYATAFNPTTSATAASFLGLYDSPQEFLGNAKDFTISMWFKPENPTAAINRAIWVMGWDAGNRIRCYISSGGELQVVWKRASAADSNVTSVASGFNAAIWNHLTVCVSKYGTLGTRAAIEVYLNGLLITSGGTQGSIPESTRYAVLNLGSNPYGSAFYPEMYYSGIRIDQRMLSASEIESLALQPGPYMLKGVQRIAQ